MWSYKKCTKLSLFRPLTKKSNDYAGLISFFFLLPTAVDVDCSTGACVGFWLLTNAGAAGVDGDKGTGATTGSALTNLRSFAIAVAGGDDDDDNDDDDDDDDNDDSDDDDDDDCDNDEDDDDDDDGGEYDDKDKDDDDDDDAAVAVVAVAAAAAADDESDTPDDVRGDAGLSSFWTTIFSCPLIFIAARPLPVSVRSMQGLSSTARLPPAPAPALSLPMRIDELVLVELAKITSDDTRARL